MNGNDTCDGHSLVHFLLLSKRAWLACVLKLHASMRTGRSCEADHWCKKFLKNSMHFNLSQASVQYFLMYWPVLLSFHLLTYPLSLTWTTSLDCDHIGIFSAAFQRRLHATFLAWQLSHTVFIIPKWFSSCVFYTLFLFSVFMCCVAKNYFSKAVF